MTVSVLIMSRGRPESLDRTLVSLMREPGVEVLVRIDSDDERRTDYRKVAGKHPGITLNINPRPVSLGEGFNSLAAVARGDVLMAFPDDYTVVQPDWGARLTAAASCLGGLGFVSPRDPLHPGFPSIIAVPRRTYDLLGYIIAPHFPFWFGDTWWDEIREMTGMWADADFDVEAAERGKVTGIADLDFWARVFEATRAERAADAVKLLAAAYIEPVLGLCAAKVAHLRRPELVARWEAKQAAPPSARYLEHRAAMASKYGVEI